MKHRARSSGRLRTRIVRALRVILPLAALGVLSMLFLLSRDPSPEAAIPYVDAEGTELAQKKGMTAARYAGVSADGAQVTLSAARANPGGDPSGGSGDGEAGGEGSGDAQDLALKWQAPGMTADLIAASGEVDGDKIRLGGGVSMTTSTGWTLNSANFDADTALGRIVAPAEVKVQAPFGTLDAGSMDLSRHDGGDHVLDLKGRVRLIYRP